MRAEGRASKVTGKGGAKSSAGGGTKSGVTGKTSGRHSTAASTTPHRPGGLPMPAGMTPMMAKSGGNISRKPSFRQGGGKRTMQANAAAGGGVRSSMSNLVNPQGARIRVRA